MLEKYSGLSLNVLIYWHKKVSAGQNMDNYATLLQHYEKSYKKRVFYEQHISSLGSFGILYTYDFPNEIGNFVSTFSSYLPYFVRNEDSISLEVIDCDIDLFLKNRSQFIWTKSKTISHRPIEMDGIFGELFLDFYLRIVNKRRTLLSYASRRNFNEGRESYGIDHVCFEIVNQKVEIFFSEAKFVEDKNRVRSGFLHDINGDKVSTGHLTKEYFNSFLSFILEKNDSYLDSDKQMLTDLFKILNFQFSNGTNDFLGALTTLNLKIHFVFFAIFQDDHKNIDVFNNIYKLIYDEAIKSIIALGFNNYEIEIVFIPTNFQCLFIKEQIDGFLKR